MDPARLSYLADLASLVGFGVTVIGFLVTVVAVLKAKGAAQKAEGAARSTRESIVRSNSVANCATALAHLESARQLIRAEAWEEGLEKLGASRQGLLVLKADALLGADTVVVVQGVVAQIGDIETKMERAHGGKPTDKVRLSGVIGKQIEKIQEIEIALKQGLPVANV